MRFGCLVAILILTGCVLRLSPGLWACLGGGGVFRGWLVWREPFIAWLL
jgi:hypothetical protein